MKKYLYRTAKKKKIYKMEIKKAAPVYVSNPVFTYTRLIQYRKPLHFFSKSFFYSFTLLFSRFSKKKSTFGFGRMTKIQVGLTPFFLSRFLDSKSTLTQIYIPPTVVVNWRKDYSGRIVTVWGGVWCTRRYEES